MSASLGMHRNMEDLTCYVVPNGNTLSDYYGSAMSGMARDNSLQCHALRNTISSTLVCNRCLNEGEWQSLQDRLRTTRLEGPGPFAVRVHSRILWLGKLCTFVDVGSFHQDHQWSSAIGKNIYGTFSWTASTALFDYVVRDPAAITEVLTDVMARRVVHCTGRVRSCTCKLGRCWKRVDAVKGPYRWQRAVQRALRVSWWSSKIVMITFINVGPIRHQHVPSNAYLPIIATSFCKVLLAMVVLVGICAHGNQARVNYKYRGGRVQRSTGKQ